MKKLLALPVIGALVVWRWRKGRLPYFDPEAYWRARDIHGIVHFARSVDEPFGSVACNYHARHPHEVVPEIGSPGLRMDGILCVECLKIIRPDL